MQEQANFAKLKESVSMEMLLGHYGLLDGLKRVKEDELVGFCPFHDETKGSFHISLSKNAWHCFGCKAHGNILDFVMAKENVGVREAGVMIQGWFLISPQNAPEAPERRVQRRSGGKEPERGDNPPLTLN